MAPGLKVPAAEGHQPGERAWPQARRLEPGGQGGGTWAIAAGSSLRTDRNAASIGWELNSERQ